MRSSSSLRVQTSTAAMLAMLLFAEPLVAGGRVPHPEQLAGDDRVLHALNRVTFGPQPGDVARVEAMGLDRWLDQQLHPGSIDDSALDQSLKRFPAMQLSQTELLDRFPDPQRLRVMARQSSPLPTDPAERAIYRNGIYAEREREAKKAEKSDGDAAAVPGKAPVKEDGAAPPKGSAVRRPDMLGSASGYSIPYGKKQPPAAATDAAAGGMTATSDPAAAMRVGAAGSMPTQGTAAAEAPRGGVTSAVASTHRERFYPERDTAALLALSPGQRMDRILGMDPETMGRLRQSLSADELTRIADGLSPQQKETLAALGGPNRVVVAELLQSRLERDIESNRQIEAVMTDFWLNHFNVYLRKNQLEPYLLPSFEREVRAHALGKFENLLVATASSPAMLVYLDNAESIGPHSAAAELPRRPQAAATGKGKAAARGLNENYARELMELHTVGVRCEVTRGHTPSDPSCGPGYTQADVTEVARVLSGWTVTRREEGSTATYIDRRHEPGDKRVLGHVIHNGGEREGLELLHLLATSPATAQFVCTKLAVRFVSDAPSPSLIAQMTAAWRKSNGDISAVLRAMFHAPEFWAPEAQRSKVKTPLEFVASAVRASGAQTSDGVPLVQALDRLGMPLYGMQTPNGYAWDAEPWVSTGALVARMNFALLFAGNRLQGTTVDWSRVLPDQASDSPVRQGEHPPRSSDAPRSAAAEAARLEIALLGRPASVRVQQALIDQSGEIDLPRRAEQSFLGGQALLASAPSPAAPAADKRTATMAGLLLGSPDFQRR